MWKDLLKSAVHRTGAIGLVQGLNRNRVRILMYHRFPAADAGNFDRQCEYLAACYKVVSLPEAGERLRANTSLANLEVITVDDGYADMHDVAFPILRKHKLPATLFVTTGFIDGTDWMPGDRVRHHFAHTPKDAVEVTDDKGEVHRFQTRGKDATEGLRELLKRVPNRTRARILAELADGAAGEPGSLPSAYRPCTWEELRAMSDAGVSIGAHTVTHPILSRVETGDEVEREIVGSKQRIETRLQKEVGLFAYPNGTAEDLNEATVRCARAHFACAVTAIPGLNPPGADVYHLLRLPCDPVTPVPQMARMLAGPLRRGSAVVSGSRTTPATGHTGGER